ncbi:MAG: hypothetical protein SFW62_07050 [Alphaproteobacteria bacterium]|nr:hypothetical protein [Alphaproteobacteria bacterium]
MMTRLFFVFLLSMTFFSFAARADHMDRPDDRLVFDLSAEDWVMTKTARVMVNVEAAVSGSTAGNMRADMIKAVNDLIKAEWRLTAFNRSEDQTGMERWSASFEARVPESQLNGLADNVKKASKAGMQLSVGNVDFSPTLEEMEAARAGLRTQIYKQANEQLAATNAAMPGRGYRIALVNFTGDDVGVPMPRVMKGRAAEMNMMMAAAPASPPPSMERAEKVTLTARVVFAAFPDGKTAPADAKR